MLRLPGVAKDDSSAGLDRDQAGPEAGGYIVLDLPEDQKSIFHDVLKGFEEYAAIRGYRIQFSIDGSLPNKIAFKFTLMEPGLGVSTSQVKKDLQDYIQKVQKGDPLDDLPIVLPQPEHNALLLAMKNRISFLQHTYSAQRNVLEFYENTMRRFPNLGFPVMPSQNFYLQSGGALMGDTFFTGQAGAVGPHSSATHFQQLWNANQSGIDLKVLADELGRLRGLLRADASTPDHDVAIGAVAEAESAARSGDGPKALQHLQRAGKWVLDVATKIGAEIASSAIKAACGIGP